MNHMNRIVGGVAALGGLLSHILYFIRGEHHKQALLFCKLIFAVPLIGCLVLVHLFRFTIAQASQLTVSATAAYLGALWSSMIVYRLFFHRLRRFPGPPLAKVSKLYHMLSLGRMDNHRQLARWHKQHGNFVRTGPGELSIISPGAPVAILGPGGCLKSAWYDYNTGQSLHSLHSTRDHAVHESRRRIWDRGFSSKALSNYEARIIDYTSELMVQISARVGEPMVVSTWFHYFSFDIMGDLAFGKSFEMLRSGKTHFAMDLLHEGLLPLGVLSPIPWLVPVMAAAPLVGAGYRRFILWCRNQIEARQKMKIEVPDITTWLLKDPKGDQLWLNGDARLIVVAGTDTVAVTLTHVFYYLAIDPIQVEKLRAELNTLIKPDTPFKVRDVQSGDHLNGIIHEALRMHPPIASGTNRITPPQGITIDDVFVPGDINVSVPHYAIGRSEDCYVCPNEFIPERWYSRPELIKHKAAFAPFSLGPYNCIGKQLALMEMRTIVSLLVTRFDVRLAPGEDGTTLIEHSKDTFTLRMGDLRLVFEERAGSGVTVGGERMEGKVVE